jgi:anti-sigma factor RsiW
MKCEDVSRELIPYLDRRANSAERREVEEHLASCVACRARAEEFRKLWNVLDEVPAIEPSLGFNARVRQSVAVEPRPRWYRWIIPQPRLAVSMAMLLALSIWMARLPDHSMTHGTTAATEEEDFNAIKDLGVLENYDVLTKFDALSELPPATSVEPDKSPQDQQAPDDNGGM